MSDKKSSVTPLGCALLLLGLVSWAVLLCFAGCAPATIARPGVEDACVHQTGHKCYDGRRSCVSSDEERAAYKKCLEEEDSKK